MLQIVRILFRTNILPLMKTMIKYIFLLSCLLIQGSARAETTKHLIYKINIKQEIDNTTRLYLRNGLDEAKALGADAVLIHMNTYGGQLDAADSMRTAILYSPIPVSVFIDNNAASAGALISIACKNIYMRKGGSIGAATVVNQTGEAMPDKYQSYMRSMIRSTAEAQGKDTLILDNGADTIYKWKRDPLIAEAMVDERVVVPNLIDTGKVLTFTAEDALKWGYCDGLAETPDEVITQYLGYPEYEIKEYVPTFLDKLKGFLLNPILQSLLIMMIIGGIYFEMQSPGLGFPSVVSILAAVLYFAPLYVDGLAEHWEIILFVIGVLLLIAEVFVIPGFGVAGISGIVLVIFGLTMGLIGNDRFDFDGVTAAETARALLTVLMGIGLGFASILWLSSRIGEKGIFRKMALHTNLEKTVAMAFDVSGLIGREGEAVTVLRPSGKVNVDGEIYDAVSDTGFIERGEKVKIVRFENSQLYVENINID